MGSPAGETADVFASLIVDEELFVAAETDSRTLATTPFGIVFVLNPLAKQVVDPGLLEQLMDFPARLAAGPAVTVIPEKSADE